MENEVAVVEEVMKTSGSARKWILIGGVVVIGTVAAVALIKKIRKSRAKKLTVLTQGDELTSSEGTN